MPILQIETSIYNTCYLVVLKGRLDANSYNQFHHEMQRILNNWPLTSEKKGVICDITGIEYLSGAGLREFAHFFRKLRGRGKSFYLIVEENSSPMDVLILGGLDQFIQTFPDQISAIGSL